MNKRTVKLIIAAFLLFRANTLSVTAQEQERILIAYFTWAENTEIIDRARAVTEANNHVFSMENNSSADTVTSASVIPPGNTTRLALRIREVTGGDLFSIRVKEKYSCYWDECLNRASEEKARRARPELTEHVKNIADYDVVFLGFPTWWYTIPMPVTSFVESHDLSGKKIMPFVSHGTSGIAGTIRDLKRLLPSSASVGKEIGIYRSTTGTARPAIENWLKEIGYTK
jgi:flavodoxin